MSPEYFTQKRLAQIFGTNISKTNLFKAIEQGLIPSGKKFKSGAINQYGWPFEALPNIGKQFGHLHQFAKPLSMAVFTTKGGVLKTTLTLNIARSWALHGVRTCVVGLDVQGDITQALGHNADLEGSSDLKEIIGRINETKGLADVFNSTARLEDVILPTEIPTLFYIPETPELATFNEAVNNINRREYWLREKIINRLKDQFDLIIMDCSPNWNRLITNALVACDVLLSPLECKINNFRNFRVFDHFLNEFKAEMNLHFLNMFIPTKYAPNRKLCMEISNWYQENIPDCLNIGIRESVISEEATALRKSLIEHGGTKTAAEEMRKLLITIQKTIDTQLPKKESRPLQKPNSVNLTKSPRMEASWP